jgi:hypothetical protein
MFMDGLGENGVAEFVVTDDVTSKNGAFCPFYAPINGLPECLVFGFGVIIAARARGTITLH